MFCLILSVFFVQTGMVSDEYWSPLKLPFWGLIAVWTMICYPLGEGLTKLYVFYKTKNNT